MKVETVLHRAGGKVISFCITPFIGLRHKDKCFRLTLLVLLAVGLNLSHKSAVKGFA